MTRGRRVHVLAKPIYTTGDLARFLKVSPGSVAKMIDGGHIQGVRLPGSQHRRVYHAALVKFLIQTPAYRPLIDEIKDTQPAAR